MLDCTAPSEQARLDALHALDVLDTAPEEAFDRITRLARTVLQVPIALVSLVDRDRQWFKSRQGLDVSETPRSVSFCARAIEQDAPLIVPDALLDPRFADNPLVTSDPHIRFYIGVQLRNKDGFSLGTLCCIDVRPRQLTSDQIAVLQDLGRLVIDELELRLIATTDSLTGAMTRRAFLDAARRDVPLSRRHDRPLSCLMIDADHFKCVNDTYGHAAGDEVLRRLVTVCKAQLRTSDYIGRLGGEEFAILLRETRASDGVIVADRLRVAISSEVFQTPRGPFGVTISSGLSELNPSIAGIEDLIEHADRALYEAKASGRNRNVVWAPSAQAAE